MYSMILMTAMATSGDTASFNWRSNGCGGCNGCGGSSVVYHAAPTTYSVGCYGSPRYAVGGCFGCRGSSGCTGCTGCWGGSFYRGSCHGCSGSSCCGGGCFGSHSSPVAIPAVEDCCGAVTVPTTATPTATGESPANLKLDLPADSKLYVDGQLIPGTGATRTFATPKLPAGRSFVYKMTAEILVDGSTVREEIKVVVHAGDDVRKSFGKLIAATTRETPTAVAKK